MYLHFLFILSFNTQPPKGGWDRMKLAFTLDSVSTHSRLKAAGYQHLYIVPVFCVSTHSRLKAAGLNRSAMGLNLSEFQHTAA